MRAAGHQSEEMSHLTTSGKQRGLGAADEAYGRQVTGLAKTKADLNQEKENQRKMKEAAESYMRMVRAMSPTNRAVQCDVH